MTLQYYNLSLKKTRIPRAVTFKDKWKNPLTILNSTMNTLLKNARNLKNQTQTIETTKELLDILNQFLIPTLFGTNEHRKVFDKIIIKILTQSRDECIFYKQIISKFHYKKVQWLENFQEDEAKHFYIKAILVLLEKIIKPLILHYYKPINLYCNEMKLITRPKWQQFEAKVFNDLLKLNHLIPVNAYRLHRGNLRIIPKNSSYRIIVRCKRTPCAPFKLLNSKLYKCARDLNKLFSHKLYKSWTDFLQINRDSKLFACKLDIKDCFGNVDINALLEIIQQNDTLKRNLSYLTLHVTNQFVVYGNSNNEPKIWQWKHGLIQGDHLSASLCELYMTYKDNCLLEFKTCHNFIHRTVDDYIFCSTSKGEVENFISKLSSLVVINEDKTVTNFQGMNEIPYCGFIFNLTNNSVKKLYKFDDNYPIRHKFKVWNTQKKFKDFYDFLLHSCSYNRVVFSTILFNTTYNTEEIVFENFYELMIYHAFRFDTALNAIKDLLELNDEKIVQICWNIIEEGTGRGWSKINKLRGKNFQNCTYKNILVLAKKAFIVVLQLRNERYKFIIESISKGDLKLWLQKGTKIKRGYFGKLPDCFRKLRLNRSVTRDC